MFGRITCTKTFTHELQYVECLFLCSLSDHNVHYLSEHRLYVHCLITVLSLPERRLYVHCLIKVLSLPERRLYVHCLNTVVLCLPERSSYIHCRNTVVLCLPERR